MTKAFWEATADELLLALRPYFSARHARVVLPGVTSSSGAASDALEGFARSFLLAAFRLAGADGDDPHGYAEWYRAGIVAGTDPDSAEAWPTLTACRQAKVEASSIAISLDLTRPWIWDRLSPAEQANVIDWLAPSVSATDYVDNNWLWFQVVTQTFLYSVGGPRDLRSCARCLLRLEEFYREDGWYGDGKNRNFDYYCGWAMQLYPIAWQRMRGATEMLAQIAELPGSRQSRALTPDRVPIDRDRMLRYVADLLHFFGADGAPVYQGRSLIYRFAMAVSLWLPALADVSVEELARYGMSYGQLRRAGRLVLEYFLAREPRNDAGVLTLGWWGEWSGLKQHYSGAGSPYWAVKGLECLLLPESHPLWQEPEAPLPIERGDFTRIIRPAGWILCGTADDGVVRLYNVDADERRPEDYGWDVPEYTRYGYSTVTTPLYGEAALRHPAAQAVCLLRPAAGAGAAGVSVSEAASAGLFSVLESAEATHRGGMKRLYLRGLVAADSAADSGSLTRAGAEFPALAATEAGADSVSGGELAGRDLGVFGAIQPELAGAVGASEARVHWVDFTNSASAGDPIRNLPLTEAGTLRVYTYVHRAWQLQLVHCVDLRAAQLWLEVSGWPVTGAEVAEVAVAASDAAILAATRSCAVAATSPISERRYVSALRPVELPGQPGMPSELSIRRATEVSPVGDHTAIPVARVIVRRGDWLAFAASLRGEALTTAAGGERDLDADCGAGCGADCDAGCGAGCGADLDIEILEFTPPARPELAPELMIRWPDGRVTRG